MLHKNQDEMLEMTFEKILNMLNEVPRITFFNVADGGREEVISDNRVSRNLMNRLEKEYVDS